MPQSHLVLAIGIFVVLEAVNTAVNILPAMRQPTEAGKTRYFLRAGGVSLVLVAGLVAYLVLDR